MLLYIFLSVSLIFPVKCLMIYLLPIHIQMRGEGKAGAIGATSSTLCPTTGMFLNKSLKREVEILAFSVAAF